MQYEGKFKNNTHVSQATLQTPHEGFFVEVVVLLQVCLYCVCVYVCMYIYIYIYIFHLLTTFNT